MPSEWTKLYLRLLPRFLLSLLFYGIIFLIILEKKIGKELTAELAGMDIALTQILFVTHQFILLMEEYTNVLLLKMRFSSLGTEPLLLTGLFLFFILKMRKFGKKLKIFLKQPMGCFQRHHSRNMPDNCICKSKGRSSCFRLFYERMYKENC